jgi:hypothetical protein
VRRNWLVAAAVVGVAVIVIAAVLGRVKDDDSGSVDTATWAESVCASLVDWRSSITSLADVSGETLTPELLGEKLDDAEAATDELVTELEDLGPPDLEAGDQVEQALDDAVGGLRTSYASLQAQAQDAVGAESPTEFLQALAALAPEFQSLLNQIRDTVASLQSASLFGEASAELEQAFASAGSCQELQADR